MKSITIAGNVTKDAELRTTQSGQSVAGFSVAVNGYENGEKTSTFFDVSVWGKRGEAVTRFATKGSKICVTGDLGTREYNGKIYLTIRANDFTPMGGGQSSGDAGAQRPSAAGNVDNGGLYAGGIDDEIPF